MSLIEDFGLDSPARSSIVLTLSIEDNKKRKLTDILHLQKIIRYFQYLTERSEIGFSNFNLGGVSYEITENIDTLEDCGLVEKNKRHFKLTREGNEAAEELKKDMDPKDLKKLLFAKHQLNDLSTDEVMFFMYMLIPETRQNSTEFERNNKRRREFSKSLFLKGKINKDTAIRWSGLSKDQFENILKRRG